MHPYHGGAAHPTCPVHTHRHIVFGLGDNPELDAWRALHRHAPKKPRRVRQPLGRPPQSVEERRQRLWDAAQRTGADATQITEGDLNLALGFAAKRAPYSSVSRLIKDAAFPGGLAEFRVWYAQQGDDDN